MTIHLKKNRFSCKLVEVECIQDKTQAAKQSQDPDASKRASLHLLPETCRLKSDVRLEIHGKKIIMLNFSSTSIDGHALTAHGNAPRNTKVAAVEPFFDDD